MQTLNLKLNVMENKRYCKKVHGYEGFAKHTQNVTF